MLLKAIPADSSAWTTLGIQPQRFNVENLRTCATVACVSPVAVSVLQYSIRTGLIATLVQVSNTQDLTTQRNTPCEFDTDPITLEDVTDVENAPVMDGDLKIISSPKPTKPNTSTSRCTPVKTAPPERLSTTSPIAPSPAASTEDVPSQTASPA